MTGHFALMVLFSLFLSVVFATLMRDEPGEQVRLGARMFAALVGGGLLAGWLLFPLPLQVSRRTLALWAPVAVYMAAIFYVSSLPDVPMPSNVSDTSLHSLAYLGLAVTTVRAVAGGLPRPIGLRTALAGAAIAIAYGVTDEVHQLFVPGRTAELRDLAADTSGALIGTALCWAWGIIAPSRSPSGTAAR